MQTRWSVRKLVTFTLRSGDIDNGFFSNRRALEGIRLHQKLQKQYPSNFESEMDLSGEVHFGETRIFLEGRVDGIDRDANILDEIKSTIYEKKDIDARENTLHWAQLKCYGYLYCKDRHLEKVTLRLTYIRIEDEVVFSYDKVFSFQELSFFMEDVILRLEKIQSRLKTFEEKMRASAKSLTFPYKTFRRGQREMAVGVYRMIQTSDTLLIEAPTGIGKTLATLFSSIKAIGEGISQGVFYATARTTGKSIACGAMAQLAECGLRIKTTELIAKEKACINREMNCSPDACPYAKGHYDRLIDGILDIYDHEDLFSGEVIRAYSEKHRLCPFEFGLDLSNFSTIIVGDYNYIFHPKSFLERLMEDRDRIKSMTLLIDEAHNLIDRARDMYSLSLSTEVFKALDFPTKASKQAARVFLEQLANVSGVPLNTAESLPTSFDEALEDVIDALARFFSRANEEPTEELLNGYFSLLDWQHLTLFYNKTRFTYFVPKKGILSLLCLDPSQVLYARKKLFGATVYFSATLTPMDYHKYCLGAGEDAKHMQLPSPFNPAHLLVLHPPHVSTKYADREKSLEEVSRYLRVFTETEAGNFMHFFPSYAYKNQLIEANRPWDNAIHDQFQEMTEKERRAFIRRFEEASPVHGYGVMGGVFSEGIDLVGERLKGVSILTLSLPGLSHERELIKKRFNALGKNGYDFAYTYPGMTKVTQAAGRIIRTEQDRGQLLLLDDRFLRRDIRALLPAHWQIQIVKSPEDMQKIIENFWRLL